MRNPPYGGRLKADSALLRIQPYCGILLMAVAIRRNPPYGGRLKADFQSCAQKKAARRLDAKDKQKTYPFLHFLLLFPPLRKLFRFSHPSLLLACCLQHVRKIQIRKRHLDVPRLLCRRSVRSCNCSRWRWRIMMCFIFYEFKF